MARKFVAELLGTALLVLFGAGAATLVFGFRIFGSSYAAGLVAVALAFGLIYGALVCVIGPISGGHVNPAVSLGAFLGKRLTPVELVGYWIAQLVGAILGTLVLWWMLSTSPFYDKARVGLGANGYGANSFLRVGAGGAFLAEVVLTAVFVLVVLSLTREGASLAVAGMGIAIALALANLVGIPFDGASINPARSFGPAIVAGGSVLSQLWLFLIAPLVGGLLAAGIHMLLYPAHATAQDAVAGDRFRHGGYGAARGSAFGPAATPAGTGAPAGMVGTPAGPGGGASGAAAQPGTMSGGTGGGYRPASGGPEGGYRPASGGPEGGYRQAPDGPEGGYRPAPGTMPGGPEEAGRPAPGPTRDHPEGARRQGSAADQVAAGIRRLLTASRRHDGR